MTDVELLNQHQNGSDSAFADLVRRHLNWVYGLARRRVRDAHLAEDVAQAVFVILHRKSPKFAADGAMIGWLHKTACYAADTATRSERRRHAHETTAAAQREAQSPEPSEWLELAPMLDRLIEKLSPEDRQAILLRYYRDLSFAEVGEQMASTAEAARKRVDRAIDKLRKLAEGGGFSASAIALAGYLGTFARVIPPHGLLATTTVAATAPAGSALASSCAAIVKGAASMTTATKIGIVAGSIAGAVILVGATVGITAWLVTPASTNPQSAASPPAAVSAPTPSTPAAPRNPAAQTLSPPQQPSLALAPRDPHNFDHLAPFTAVAWKADMPQVLVDGKWYELVSIDDIPAKQLIDYANTIYNFGPHKHFSEDLVEVMTRMGHEPVETVKLILKTQDTAKQITLPNVPMTTKNRDAVRQYNNDHNS
jgi:RNA polymerase sigma factor (sigma-70 family)